MKKPTKRELLEKYQTREPTLFVQIDAIKTTADGDNLVQPDGDGFWLHDCAAFATYLCTDAGCASATTLWNQA